MPGWEIAGNSWQMAALALYEQFFLFSLAGVKHVGRRTCSAGLCQAFCGRVPVSGFGGFLWEADNGYGWCGGRTEYIILTFLPKKKEKKKWLPSPLPASCQI